LTPVLEVTTRRPFFDPVTAVGVLVPIVAVVYGWRRRIVITAWRSVIHWRRRRVITATRCDRSAYAEADNTSDYRCTCRITAAAMVGVTSIVMPILGVGDRG
jgi:hypothetical protein